LHRRPAAVHEGHRFDEQNLAIVDQTASEHSIKFLMVTLNIKILGDFIGDHEADIMPGVPVVVSRVSESNHQF
jgi:hypothetical protein